MQIVHSEIKHKLLFTRRKIRDLNIHRAPLGRTLLSVLISPPKDPPVLIRRQLQVFFIPLLLCVWVFTFEEHSPYSCYYFHTPAPLTVPISSSSFHRFQSTRAPTSFVQAQRSNRREYLPFF
jgi:hypothetical protein